MGRLQFLVPHCFYTEVKPRMQLRCVFAMLAMLILALSGCGVSRSSSTTPSNPALSTQVVLLATSTGNDHISGFDVDFESITLTSSSGMTVSLLPTNEHAEFMHLNGTAEPLFSTSVPQDTYSSASVTLGPLDFICYGGSTTGNNATGIFAYGYTPPSAVTVNVASPIVVQGNSMGISINLQVSDSATWSSPECFSQDPSVSFSISPTFDLSPVGNGQSGLTQLTGLAGTIASVAQDELSITGADGPSQGTAPSGGTVSFSAPSWQVALNADTTYQGVSGQSALTQGQPIDFDATLQSDGSLLATRVEVLDSNTATLSVSNGPLIVVLSSNPILSAAALEASGPLYANDLPGDAWGVSYNNAEFQVSGELTNLQQLPFAAKFDATSLAAGQVLSITSNSPTNQPWPIYIPAATITLLPQTIDGTVQQVSTEGSFQVYTVTLADYDTFPQLATQTLQTTVLSDPTTITVYADSNTRMLNTNPISVGVPVRFHGAVFDDNGALRMDCLQINDGVPE